MSKKYIIGTRGSLLALTQCGQVKRQLEQLTGDQFELKIIKTEGDENTSVPLWQLDGKDFFTKELDAALLKGEVDLVVHSYKDLGSDRPEGIELAAITKRSFAHDILLINKERVFDIPTLSEFVVGTSSPRRITNIESQLGKFLPASGPLKVSTKMLRGNVNSRIKKLIDGEYDAICLALAGLDRLAQDDKAMEEMGPMLEKLNFMVLPQRVFPSSASQGALGIECATTADQELKDKLKKVHHDPTAECVAQERKAFNEYGGGCHLAVGIHVRKAKDHFLHIHRGEFEKDNVKTPISIEKLDVQPPSKPSKEDFVFIGLEAKREVDLNQEHHLVFDELIRKEAITDTSVESDKKDTHLFYTSNHCLHELNNIKEMKSLWAAGTQSMKKLAANRYWVNGSADGLGTQELQVLLSSHAIRALLDEKDTPKWNILTNDESQHELGESIPCYTRKIISVSDDYREQVEKCTHFFWTSFHQYEIFLETYPAIKDAIHCCGVGKTLNQFTEKNINVSPFSSLENFRHWLQAEAK